MRQSGITTDGRPVMAGLFDLYETHGVPTEVLMYGMVDNGCVPDWLDLHDCALASGMKQRNVHRLIRTMAELVTQEWADGVMERLHKFRPLAE